MARRTLTMVLASPSSIRLLAAACGRPPRPWSPSTPARAATSAPAGGPEGRDQAARGGALAGAGGV